jgi:hypothetical protein
MADQSEKAANASGDSGSSNTETAGTDLGNKNVGAAVSKPEGAKTSLISTGVDTTSGTSNVEPGTGPGFSDVGTIGIVCLTLYLIAAILLCFYGLIVLWPGPSPSGQLPPGTAVVTPTPNPSTTLPSDSTTQGSLSTSAPVSTPTLTPSAALAYSSPTQTSSTASPQVNTSVLGTKGTRSPITIFGRQFEIWDEVRLLLIVILAGALGSLVHTVRSVYWYIGNRSLKWSWLAKYVLQPFAGSALAVIFYVVVRGGFFSPQTTFENTSPFGFAALSALVGLFSEQAVLKLKRVAETVLERPAPGADATQQEEGSSGPPDETTKVETQ